MSSPGRGSVPDPLRRSTWLAVALALVGSVTLADPARAQDGGGTVEWLPLQSERGRAVPDDAVTGTVSIGARIRRDDVQWWNVDVMAPPGASYPGFGTVCAGEAGDQEQPIDVECPWDTTVYPGGDTSWNHAYILHLSVASNDGTRQRATDRKVVIANRATPPADVRLSLNDSHQMRLEWNPNPEPDIAAYVIEERTRSRGWYVIAEVTGTSYGTRVEEPGTHWYRLAALRRVAESRRAPPSWARPEPNQITIDSPSAPEDSDPVDGDDGPAAPGTDSGEADAPEPGDGADDGGQAADPAPGGASPPGADQPPPGEPEAAATPLGDSVSPPAHDVPAATRAEEGFPAPRLTGLTTTWTTELALPVAPAPGSGPIGLIQPRRRPASGAPGRERKPALRPPAAPPALAADPPPADEGFALTLPYETRRPNPYPVPGRGSEPEPGLPRKQVLIANAAAADPRAALASLAGGFALVVLALQLAHVARLSGPRCSWEAGTGAPRTA